MDTYPAPTRAPQEKPGAILPRAITIPLLVAGPLACLQLLANAVGGPWLLSDQFALVAVLNLAVWSPLWFSIPAFLLQDARDQALPHLTGLLGTSARALLLIPHLLLSPSSPVRQEMAASLLGFSLAGVTTISLL